MPQLRLQRTASRKPAALALAALLAERAAAHQAGDAARERELRARILNALPVYALGSPQPAAADENAKQPLPAPAPGTRAEPPRPLPAVRAPATGRCQPRRARRQSIYWDGELFWDERSAPVQLHDVSPAGAKVIGGPGLAPGTEVVLTLKSAGAIFAKVRWCDGASIGLEFEQSFDVNKLRAVVRDRGLRTVSAGHRAMLVPTWLDSETDPDSPWAANWDRLDANELTPPRG